VCRRAAWRQRRQVLIGLNTNSIGPVREFRGIPRVPIRRELFGPFGTRIDCVHRRKVVYTAVAGGGGGVERRSGTAGG